VSGRRLGVKAVAKAVASAFFVFFAWTRARAGSLRTEEAAREVSGCFAFVETTLDDDAEPSGEIVVHGPCGVGVCLSNTSFLDGGLGFPKTELNAASSEDAEKDEPDDTALAEGCEVGWRVGSSVMVG